MRPSGSSLLPLLLLAACPSNSQPAADASPAETPPAKPSAPETPSTPTAPSTPPTTPPDAMNEDTPETPAEAPPRAEPDVVGEVATGFNAFGVDLYRKVAAEPGDIVISPASVALALTMTHAGARGETAKEMETALHFPRAAPVVQSAVATMLGDWNAPREDVELSVANRLFGDGTVPYETPFLALTKRFFDAPLEPVDFKGAHEAARLRINGWVEDETHDRIQNLLPEGAVDSSTRLVLVNAIYFKAAWMSPFTDFLTAPAPFHAAGGDHDVPTMHVTEHFSFAEAEGVQVVQLPYVDPRFAMTVVIPTATDGLAAVEASLSAETVDGWVGALAGERLSLSMPKFRIAPGEALRLREILGELGIVKAFGDDADLTGIAPASEQLQLSEAFHKGFIEVDEKGTEAAAATAIAARAGSAAPVDEPREVKVDRPFLYLIRDTRSGLLLFMGRVTDPKTE
ncbi:MAG: serpin family protein [Myxococcales bacterium]|nr:serpin family protein [Myxococcales bacterium]